MLRLLASADAAEGGHVTKRPYADPVARCGLVLSMGEVPAPVSIEPDAIVAPDGWKFDKNGRGWSRMEMGIPEEPLVIDMSLLALLPTVAA